MNDELNPPAQVAICIPSGRTWGADTAARIAAICMRAMSHGIRTILVNESNSVISFSRNSMAEFAINNGATHIMWIDSDNVPPIDVVKRFLDLDKDIVGSAYCKRVPPYELLGTPMKTTDLAKGGVVPYWTLPGGCVMVKAKVYRTVPKPWYFNTQRSSLPPIESFVSLLDDHYRIPVPTVVKEFFEKSHDLNSWLKAEEEENASKYCGAIDTGEDVSFCLKAQRYGFKIWCDLDATCETGHTGETTIYPRKPDKNEEKDGNI